jgi:ribosomal protein S18 acetylase RimI-like enzyme
MVEHIVANFVRSFDEKREHCWIAEMAGGQVDCVFLVRKSDTIAQLRLLLVDTKGRGLGIGKRLVDELVRFARDVGYEKITLETNDVAVVARDLYRKTGFRLVHSTPHRIFSRDLFDETWEMPLLQATSGLRD